MRARLGIALVAATTAGAGASPIVAVIPGAPDPTSDPSDPPPTVPLASDPEPDFLPANLSSEAFTSSRMPGDGRRRVGVFAGAGFSIAAGAGVSGFTSDAARGATRDGGGWDLRVGLRTRRLLGLEVSYLGSAQRISALGLGAGAVLVGNGVQGNLRVNLARDLRVSPFVFAGVAVRRYDLSNTATNTSNLANEDDVLELPVGAGFATRAGSLLLEARGEVRAAFAAELVGSAPLHRYGATLTIGYEL